MVTIKKLPIKFTFLPSKAWWLFFGVLLLGILIIFLNPKQSSQSLTLYLPANTSFFYHWSDRGSFENLDISKISVINSQEPKNKIEELKKLLQNGFTETQEIIWFRTETLSVDNFLLRLDKAERIAKWLSENHPEYSYLLIDQEVLLFSIDSALPNSYTNQPKLESINNNLSSGVNIFWSKNTPPNFLADLTAWLKLDSGLPDIYANIYQQADGQLNVHIWQNKLKQIINASSTVAWPNQANFPRGADLIFGFGDHATDQWQTVINQNIIQPLFVDLPYYRLSAKKIEEQILKNNFIYLANNNWLMVSAEDWQSRINDWAPDLTLKEVKNKLPDGTVYTELVGEQEAKVELLQYQGHDYWRLGQLYGAQIDQYYYLTNNESLIQATFVSKYQIASYLSQCPVAGDYKIIDLAQLNSVKINNEAIKKALIDQNIDTLTVLSYENSSQIGFKACLR